MKVHYDPETDTLTMRLSEHPVMESDKASPGVILDYNEHGNAVGNEILKAFQSCATLQFSKPPIAILKKVKYSTLRE
ncbi:DUF2283 domain-containing protein [Acidithiobacillus thiooxidans]|uniref:DUF2283 domain-containing protein n=1 Tax=Acidithiobacillus thiooxidans ATCC 19377 TaxID=637390 RepID=A0A543Q556_ACITH|nr:DUF2283 domain-containing protein [Acidithiobacillus thiooxidans]MDR7926889.1 DUF2283 domain-containing protein [Acidithiobacillus thiooxidans]MDX5934434.1 DUF2283 domain-containing protein [Acidithiobacillus thiooxidans]TQN51454.1 hypothetical protein DLNHIDIE_01327 [Acidithiobacillus thiooxidans ATCC 19377]